MPASAVDGGTCRMALSTPSLFRWGTRIERERRIRVRLCVAAYAYEIADAPILSDATYDDLARQSDPTVHTGHLDDWWRVMFSPHTGLWIHSHPDLAGVERAWRRLVHPAPWHDGPLARWLLASLRAEPAVGRLVTIENPHNRGTIRVITYDDDPRAQRLQALLDEAGDVAMAIMDRFGSRDAIEAYLDSPQVDDLIRRQLDTPDASQRAYPQ